VSVEQVAITVTAETESISVVRHFVTSAGRFLGMGADMDVVALLTSELTANAVGLSAGEVVVTVRCIEDRLRVEVRDFGYGLPQVAHPEAVDQGGGRGLMIVDQLADDWGVDQFLPGKIVWFEMSSTVRSRESLDRRVP
jgi:anti-sigma regulatory factor (Ser/Thr protein kinase)